MNICSVCKRCYDDSATNCDAADHGNLITQRRGNCFIVKGYKINSLIESASPFALYNAAHISSGKTVLIKFIETVSSRISRADLRNEIQSAANIHHPNLARIFEFGEIGETEFYVVLEDVSGQNLRDYLRENSPLRESYAIKIARQIAEGLEALHKSGAIHRAVNPSNIYFVNPGDSDFSVKLQNYDFGGVEQKIVANGANGIDARTEILRYLSPEQFTDEKIDFKSDLYSLAVVFYEMLLGHSPYDFLNPQAISNYVFNESDVEKLHFDLRALLAYTLKQSLQHRLNLRPPTTNNLSRQLRHLELIAAPPSIGLPNATAKQTKKSVNISPMYKPKPFVAEIKPAEIETVENKILEKQEIIPAITPAIEMSQAKNYPNKENFGSELEAVGILEPWTETPIQTFASKFSENEEPEIIIPQENENLDEPITNYKFDELDSTVTGDISENIHITNKDSEDENAEIFSSEVIEFAEPEFVEKQTKTESETERHITNSFGAYAAPRTFALNKNHAYVAGIFILVIFGGLTAASFWRSQSNDAPEQTASQETVKPETLEKKEKIAAPEKIKETTAVIEEISELPQYNGIRQNEISKTDEVSEKTRLNKTAPDQSALKVENKTTPTMKEKTADSPNENKTLKSAPLKKQNKTQTQSIEDIRTTTVIIVGQTKPVIKKVDAANRPRVVTNSRTGN